MLIHIVLKQTYLPEQSASECLIVLINDVSTILCIWFATWYRIVIAVLGLDRQTIAKFKI